MYLELSTDDQAIMDISFVQVGLSIASIFFLIAGYMIIYDNPLQTSSEIDIVAEEIESIINRVDAQWFEQVSIGLFPESYLGLYAEISHDYICIKMFDDDTYNQVIPLTQTVWICENKTLNTSSIGFHKNIKNRFGHLGTKDDPCVMDKNVTKWFQNEYNKSQKKYDENPFIWTKGSLISFEKCIIFKQVTINEKEKSIPFLEFIMIKKD